MDWPRDIPKKRSSWLPRAELNLGEKTTADSQKRNGSAAGRLPDLTQFLEGLMIPFSGSFVLFPDALVYFAPVHGDSRRRFDAQADLPPLQLQNGDAYLAADDDALTCFAR